MPKNDFNASFFHLPIQSQVNLDKIYGKDAAGLYFVAAGSDDTEQQLGKFRSHQDFKAFKTQFTGLLVLLDEWCTANDASCVISQSQYFANREINAFKLFSDNIFAERSRYNIVLSLMWAEGKRLLEQIALYIGETTIPLDYKRQVMMNLQKGLDVCTEGVLTNLLNARDALNAYSNVHAQVYHIKSRLVHECALEYLRKEQRIPAIWEIHYVNSYFNYCASTYGLRPYEDKRIAELNISQVRLEKFAQKLEGYITPEAVCNQLSLLILEDYKNFRQQFEEFLLTHKNFAELNNKVNQYLDILNQKYGLILTFNSFSFIIDGEQDDVEFAPDNSSYIAAQVTQGFCKTYLKSDAQVSKLMLTDGATLMYHTGLFWIENQNDLYLCTAEHFLTIIPPELTNPLRAIYLSILDTLLENPLYATSLNPSLSTLGDTDLIIILESKLLRLFTTLLSRNLLTEARLNATISIGIHKGINVLWYLAYKEEYSYLTSLLRHKVITPTQLKLRATEGPHAGVNTLMLLAINNQVALLDEIFTQNLVTPEQLDPIINQGPHAGKNLVWILVEIQHTKLLNHLLNKKWITANHLLAQALSGDYTGKNVLALLVEFNLYNFFTSLVANGLITQSHLADSTPPFHNIIYDLACKNQEIILLSLLKANLLSKQGIMHMVLGKNALCVMVKNKQYQLINALYNKGILSQDELEEHNYFVGAIKHRPYPGFHPDPAAKKRREGEAEDSTQEPSRAFQ